jgi:glycosidase
MNTARLFRALAREQNALFLFAFTIISQFAVRAFAADVPAYAAWPRDSIFYHVYVRSFADSDGDGIGDLPGLTSKLDYIASLGVDGILLLPIFQNDYPEYGGYATTDYAHVDKQYGGDAAWDKFIVAAHQRKLKVILDLSITQVADTHPWFVAARANLDSPLRSRFIWTGESRPKTLGIFGAPAWNPAGDGTYYFALYAPNAPTLNLSDKSTAQAMIQVAALWLGRGADGFRLDSAPNLFPVDPARPDVIAPSGQRAHAFWREFMSKIKSTKPSSFAVAEVFDGNPKALTPFYADGIDMAFDYPIYFGLLDAFSKGQSKNLAALVPATLAARPAGSMGAIFLGNHDVPGAFTPPYGRSADLLGGNLTRMQSAALLLFSLPSTPFIYYGEEIGLRGALPPQSGTDQAGQKPWSRNPMQWDNSPGRGFTTASAPWAPFAADQANVAAQDGVAGSLLETYRGLIKVRRSSPALTRGTYRPVPNSNAALFCFLREYPSERVLVAVNLSGQEVTATLDLAQLGITRAQVSDRIFGWPIGGIDAGNAANYPLRLPAYEGRWILLK